MRRTAVIALFLVAMLLVPVQAGDVTAQQEQQEDPKQPNANNTTMYLYHDGFADACAVAPRTGWHVSSTGAPGGVVEDPASEIVN